MLVARGRAKVSVDATASDWPKRIRDKEQVLTLVGAHLDRQDGRGEEDGAGGPARWLQPTIFRTAPHPTQSGPRTPH